jgi:hypothetical protein
MTSVRKLGTRDIWSVFSTMSLISMISGGSKIFVSFAELTDWLWSTSDPYSACTAGVLPGGCSAHFHFAQFNTAFVWRASKEATERTRSFSASFLPSFDEFWKWRHYSSSNPRIFQCMMILSTVATVCVQHWKDISTQLCEMFGEEVVHWLFNFDAPNMGQICWRTVVLAAGTFPRLIPAR